jgi:hypothetical protein
MDPGWGKIFKKKREERERRGWMRGGCVCIEPHRKAGDRTRVST